MRPAHVLCDIRLQRAQSNYISTDIVKISWHIFLKDIMGYAAIYRES